MRSGNLILFVGVLLLPFFVSCQILKSGGKVGKEYTTRSGLKYTILKKGTGEKPKEGDNIKTHYTGMLQDGTEFDSSVKLGKPFVFKLGKGQVIKGWDEGFALLTVGAKATLTIPPDLGYGSLGMGKIPANSTLIFSVELLDIIEPPIPFEVQGLDTLHMESGLKYIKINATKGKDAEAYRNVKVHYTGYLPDGTIFDSSVDRGMPFEFQLGAGRVIKGWDEGIAKLRIGEKARLIIPPNLGYGEKGYPPSIPPNSVLIFDVELLEVE